MDTVIENISEENLISFLKLDRNNKIIYGNYNKFINILKNEYTCTQYICNKEYKRAIILIKKLINCFKLENININELYETIKINGSLELKRVSNWKKKKIKVISNENINISCNYSYFRYINKWKYKTEKEIYKIFNYNENVIWIEKSNSEPEYFIHYKNDIIGISYVHKTLKIFKNLIKKYNLNINTNNKLDNIIFNNNINHDDFKIDLSENIYKGFFYKGLLYNKNWKKEISILKNIEFNNGILKIVIKNLTYPHIGYFLLDMNEYKIIEANKIDEKRTAHNKR